MYPLAGVQVIPPQLGGAGDRVGHVDAAGVEQPEAVLPVCHDTLHRNQVRPGIKALRLLGHELIDLGIGEGHQLAVLDLGDRKIDRIAPARETDKQPPIRRYRHAGGHLSVNQGHRFEGVGPLAPGRAIGDRGQVDRFGLLGIRDHPRFNRRLGCGKLSRLLGQQNGTEQQNDAGIEQSGHEMLRLRG